MLIYYSKSILLIFFLFSSCGHLFFTSFHTLFFQGKITDSKVYASEIVRPVLFLLFFKIIFTFFCEWQWCEKKVYYLLNSLANRINYIPLSFLDLNQWFTKYKNSIYFINCCFYVFLFYANIILFIMWKFRVKNQINIQKYISVCTLNALKQKKSVNLFGCYRVSKPYLILITQFMSIWIQLMLLMQF